MPTSSQPRPQPPATPPLRRRPDSPKHTRRRLPPPPTSKPPPLLLHVPRPPPILQPRTTATPPRGLRLPPLRRRRARRKAPLSLQLGLLLFPPRRQAVEQPQRGLRGAVERHLVLEAAALLREGAGPLVHPLVAIDLVAAGGRGRGRRLDDGVDVALWREGGVVRMVVFLAGVGGWGGGGYRAGGPNLDGVRGAVLRRSLGVGVGSARLGS